MKQIPGLLLLVAVLSLSPRAGAAQTQVTLLLDLEGAPPGSTVTAGLRLQMNPNWHTYWRNPGEVGLPTKIEWELPPGITAGEIQWPVPHKDVTAGLTSYDYSHEVVLLIPLTLAPEVAPGPQELSARVSWLECETGGSCVPGRASVGARLTIGELKPAPDAALIGRWRSKLPVPKTDHGALASWDGAAKGDTRPLLIEWSATGTNADFYAFSSDTFDIKAPTEVVAATGGRLTLRKQVMKFEGDWPGEVKGLLVRRQGDQTEAFEVTLAVSAPAVAVAPAAGPATGATGGSGGEKKPLVYWLLLAFVGGLILNIMPCVLPVIALKILGFVNQSKEEPARVRKLGVIYCVGVLASFLVMALVVIAVQQAGRVASWGMQFQNPIFLVTMITLVTLVALNLFGLFEVTLGSGTMTAASSLAAKEGPTGAFFNGVLATALATPCTAPLLAPALGFAFAQPPAIILLCFLTVGAGLAAPYLVLSFKPAWLRFLPRPGNWMVRFKVAMGFPMIAVAIWLLWVATKIFGRDGALWIGLFLVCVAIAVWIWGEFVQRGSAGRGLAMTLSLLILGGGYTYALEKELSWRNPAPVSETGIVKSGADGLEWHPWSPDAVTQARAGGRPVLVDFTADWCLTCKANKKTSIEIAETRKKLREINAITLIGDNTADRPDIAAELKKYDRAGVPLVLVYPKDAKKEPIVLPTLLTPGIVLEALEQAVK